MFHTHCCPATRRFLLSVLLVLFTLSGAAQSILNKDSDGYYLIQSATDLATFRDMVNGGQGDVNARLAADIDLSAVANWEPIGTPDHPFRGQFDGASHIVSHLKVRNRDYGGLFGYAAADPYSLTPVVIQNILLDAPRFIYTRRTDYVGAICGYVTGENAFQNMSKNAKIIGCKVTDAELQAFGASNCWGGVVGRSNYANVWGNTFSGTVSASSSVGGIVGHAYYSDLMSNVLPAATQVKAWTKNNVGTMVGGNHLSSVGWESGKNEASVVQIADPNIPALSGDTYQVGSEGQLAWVADRVAEGNSAINAKLTADMDLGGIDWQPIGDATHPFGGVLDGDSHTIRNLTVSDRSNAGLFGIVKGGAISGLTFETPRLVYAKAASNVGVVCGQLLPHSRTAYVLNCAVNGGQLNAYNGSADWGGIVGRAGENTALFACSFEGELRGYENAGGILGHAESGVKVQQSVLRTGSTVTTVKGAVGAIVGLDEGAALTDNTTEDGSTVETIIDPFVPSEDAEGVYTIYNKEHLKWLRNETNAGRSHDARLARDIDMEGETWEGIGQSGAPYSSTFDGADHTVRNVKLADTEWNGLFRYVRGGEIKNLRIDSLVCQSLNGNQMIGAVVGLCGAESAEAPSRITNCHVTASHLIGNGRNLYWGGIAGRPFFTEITDCSFQGTVTGDKCIAGIAGNPDNCKITRCTLLAGSHIEGYRTDMGGICGTGTGNTVTDCVVADESNLFPVDDPITPAYADGYYLIAKPAHLAKFAQWVNAGNTSYNARLIDDLDMSGYSNWTPIGKDKSHAFKGTFEGDNHLIKNLKFNSDAQDEYLGLFGYADGAKIRNIRMEGTSMPFLSLKKSADYVGSVCGFATNHVRIIGCHVSGSYLKPDGGSWYWGGICGKADVGSWVQGCTFQGTVYGKGYVGGIVGELNSGAKAMDCVLRSGSFIDAWDNYVGGIAGRVIDTETYIENCCVEDGSTISGPEDKVGRYVGYNEGQQTNDAYLAGNVYYQPTGATVSGEDNATCYVTEVSSFNTTLSSPTDFRIYTDIGTFYNYHTTKIRSNAFLGATALKTLSFADLSSVPADKAHKWIDLDIADGAFTDCPNFETLYLSYTVSKGGSHAIMLSPSDVRPAANAFVRCPKLRFMVDAELYSAFLADSRWSVFKNQLIRTTSMRQSEFTESGVLYARDHQKNGPADYATETADDGTTIYLTHVIGASEELGTSLGGVAVIFNDPGTTYAYRTTKVWADAFRGNADLRVVRFHGVNSGSVHTDVKMELGSYAFAECPALQYVDLVYGNTNTNRYEALQPDQIVPTDNTLLLGSNNALIRVWPSLVETFKTDARWKAYADRIVAWEQSGRLYPDEDGAVYQGYIYGAEQNSLDFSDLCSKYDTHNAQLQTILERDKKDYVSLDVSPMLVGTDETNTYYIHATGVSNDYLEQNKGHLTLYNDIGSYYTYRLVSIDSLAFRNNQLLKRLDFGDVNTNLGSAKNPLCVKIENHAFKGCTNLASIDLVYHKFTGSNKIEYLQPTQVIPAKEIFDPGQRVYVRVAPNLVNAFKADPNWATYADRIIPISTSEDHFYEAGVRYEFFPVLNDTLKLKEEFYNSKYNELFAKDYISLHTGYGRFEMNEILTPAYITEDETVRYLQVTGVDDEELDKQEGRLTLYNDIGTYNTYKTIAVDRLAFAGNEHITSVGFTDLSGNFSKSHGSELAILLPNRCFENCKNLKYIDLVYLVTEGTNHYVTLSPRQVIVGDSVFVGCHPDFEIRVPGEKYLEFVYDENWAQYRDHIVVYDYSPVAEDPITEDGVVYDYASHLINNLPTEQKGYMAWSLANIPVQIAKTIVTTTLAALTGGVFGAGMEAISTGVWSGFWSNVVAQMNATAMSYGMTIGSYIAHNTVLNLAANSTSILLSQMGAGYVSGFTAGLGCAGVWATISGLEAATMGVVKSGIEGLIASLKIDVPLNFGFYEGMATMGAITELSSTTDPVEINASEYDDGADLIGQMDINTGGFPAWWSGTAQTRNIENIYHVYIKDVKNDELDANHGKMRIYNDVGSYYHYRTVSIDHKALRGNEHIRSIEFTDCAGSFINNKRPFQMTVPDSTFFNCANLERIDMFMENTEYDNCLQPLGPENFCLMGSSVFAGCPRLTVYVAPERYEDFKNDSIWGKLNIVVKSDYEEATDDNVWGAYYSYNYIQGSLMDYKDVNGKKVYNLHISKPDNEYLEENDGELIIAVDYGTTYNYNTTYVKEKAFMGNEHLKRILISDNYNREARCFTTPSIELRDSAFADCPNLESIYLCYSAYGEEPREFKPLKPSQIRPLKGVLDGSPKAVFKIFYDEYPDYLISSSWTNYTGRLRPVLTRFDDKYVRDAFFNSALHLPDRQYDMYLHPVLEMKLDTVRNGYGWQKDLDNLRGNEKMASFTELRKWQTLRLQYLADSTFMNCRNLQRVELPATLRRIGQHCFQGCTSLTMLEVPDSVERIDACAFAGSGLRELHFNATKPASLEGSPLEFGISDYKIYVPAAFVDAYKAAWPQYAAHIVSERPIQHYYVVNMQGEAGTLAERLNLTVKSNLPWLYGMEGDYHHIDSLKVIGPINSFDVALISMLVNTNVLNHLDLSEAKLREGGEYNCKIYPPLDDLEGLNHEMYKYINVRNDDEVSSSLFSFPSGHLETLILPDCDLTYKSNCFEKGTARKLIVMPKAPLKADNKWFNENNLTADILYLDTKPFDFSEACKSSGGQPSIYCPYSIYTEMGRVKESNSHVNVYAPFKDDIVFRTIAQKGFYKMSEFGKMTSTRDWFRGSDIEYFDELFSAVRDTMLTDGCFADCKKLKSISLPVNTRYIDHTAFAGCTSLRDINVFCPKVPELENADIFDDLPEDYRIKVLSTKVDSFLLAWPEKVARHIISYADAAKTREIILPAPGLLADSLGLTLNANKMVVERGHFEDIKRLKISGKVNLYDINLLAHLAGQLRSTEDKMVFNHYHTRKVGKEYVKYIPDWEEPEEVWGNKIVPDISPANANLAFLDLSEAVLCDEEGNPQEDFVMKRYQFQNCDKLETIHLPRTMKRTPVGLFSYSNNLKTVVLGDQTNFLKNWTFNNCPRLKSITTLRGDLEFESYGYEGVFTEGFTIDTLFCAGPDVATLRANRAVQAYAKNVIAAYNDRGLMNIFSPRGIATENSLYRVEELPNEFRNNLEVRDLKALEKCFRVKDVPEGLFSGCRNLKYVTMPGELTSVGAGLFAGCDSLRYVDWRTDNGLALSDIDRSDERSPFFGLPRRTLVYAPVDVGENVINTLADGAWHTSSFFMDDKQEVEIPFAFTADHASISRAFVPGRKSTVYLPFGLPRGEAAAMGRFYDFKDYNSVDGTVTFVEVAEPQAGKPYLFLPAAVTLDVTDEEGGIPVVKTEVMSGNSQGLYGTWVRKTWTTDPQVLWGYSAAATAGYEAGQFVRIGAGASIAPMRAWLKLDMYDENTPNFLGVLITPNGEPTGVVDITDGEVDASDKLVDVYTTSGQLLRKQVPATESLRGLPAGTYIIGGRKVAVK